jgi:preprotein translocase subunit SecG
MGWLQTATVIVHVLLAAAIVGLVLIQRGKGADAGAGFGSGASGTVFGARGSANFLSRMTATMAALFFVTSLALSYLGGKQTAAPSSVLERAPEKTMPVQPSTQTPPPAAPAPSIEPVPESAPSGAADGSSPATAPASSPNPGTDPQPGQPPG